MNGSDYISVSLSMSFISGSTDNDVRCVNITILDDDSLEGNQTFTLTVTTPDPDVMLGSGTITITIIDNDSNQTQLY